MPKLYLPHMNFKESYIEALDEFTQEGLWSDLDRDFLVNRFEDYVTEFEKQRKGLGLLPGWVPHTEYWWAEGSHFIARISIRHKLTGALKKFGGHIGYEVRPTERKKGHATSMLKAALPEVKDLGIKEALITCDSDNTASQKVILSNGGVYQDEIINEDREQPTQRYWLKVN